MKSRLMKKNVIAEGVSDRIQKFAKGEMTLAEVEGMTYAQATEIARFGCELLSRGRLNDAKTIFAGLIAGNPRDTTAHTCLAAVHERMNQPAEARASYDRAVELYPDNVVALAGRGELRIRTGDHAGLEDLARAAQVDREGVTPAGRRARAILGAVAQRAARMAQKHAAGVR